MIFDVAIIGAGIVGSCIAHELSKYKLNVCILEKEDDVSCGTSKANSGIIHAGYDPEPGTLMAKLNVKGAELYPELAQKLHFDFKQTGSFVIAFSEADRAHIEKLLERGKTNGVKELRIIEKDELKSLEPEISDEACAALFAPTAGIVNPYQATWAFAENAVQNGVKLYLNSQVRSIAKAENDGLFEVQTAKGSIKTRFVVNAAGLYADKINGMAGARAFKTVPRRGEYCLLDNNCKNLANHVLFQPPSKLGKGVLVTPTVDGNILVGPSADSVKN
ncbi:MAG: FAD-dependent oxidoreductase, partial [Spirochaetaceae bacterium]|nr:FAD-dependent oxidoreductase [Spirochaetaceae bacterium]